MKCLIHFGMISMKEGTSAQLSGRGELHGGARVTTLVTLRKCTLGNKREIKTVKFVLASTKGFKGGLAWIKPSKRDMAVTFSYYAFCNELNKRFKRLADDAWAVKWDKTLWINPPFHLSGEVVQKTKEDRTQAILVVPLWDWKP